MSTGASTIAAASGRSPRIALIDVLKGAAIVAMVVYHFAWDLSAFQLIAVDVTSDLGWRIFARSIAATFLFLVGVNLVLANRNGVRAGPYARRLAVILAAALLVSLGTWWLDARTFVFFGILHQIFVASILALPFLRAPVWATLAAAAVFLAGPQLFTSPVFDAWPWYWLGLSTAPPPTVDYVPLFPWFGVVLLGLAAGRGILARPGLAVWRWKAAGLPARVLAAAGRWSLAIYLIHQPLLIGALTLAAPLLGPSEAALRRQVLSEFETSCATVGYDEAACSAYAACILAELDRHEGILFEAARHELSDEERALWLRSIETCRARTLPAPGLESAI